MADIDGTPGDDPNLDGTPQADTIRGLGGNDTIRGRGGRDTLLGNGDPGGGGPSPTTLTIGGRVIDVGDDIPRAAAAGVDPFLSGYGTGRGQIGISFIDAGEEDIPLQTDLALGQGQSQTVTVARFRVIETDAPSLNNIVYFHPTEGLLATTPSSTAPAAGDGDAGNDRNINVQVPVAIGGESQTAEFLIVNPVVDGDVGDAAEDFIIPEATRNLSFASGAQVRVDLLRSATDNTNEQADIWASITLVQAPPAPVVTDNDWIDGGRGDDLIDGGPDNDTLLGRKGDDDLFGRAGHDTLRGHAGRDELHGGDGSDGLFGGAAADELFGGRGLDALYGGDGRDDLRGGAHADVFGYRSAQEVEGDRIWDFNRSQLDVIEFDTAGVGLKPGPAAFGGRDNDADPGEVAQIEGNTGGFVTLEVDPFGQGNRNEVRLEVRPDFDGNFRSGDFLFAV